MIKVVLVDNDDAALELYRRSLVLEGLWVECVKHQIMSTTNHVLAHRPDVVVLDLEMPGAPGTWIAKVIRHSAEQRDMRVPKLILFSAADESKLRRAAREAHMDAYLSKSAGVALLAKKIYELTRSS